MRTPEMLNIAVAKSLLDVDGLLCMDDAEIDIGLFGVFCQARLAITAGNNLILINMQNPI